MIVSPDVVEKVPALQELQREDAVDPIRVDCTMSKVGRAVPMLDVRCYTDSGSMSL